MADSESTQIGYRLRIQPADLSTYPDRAKLVWFDLVVKYGLQAKRRDLRRGKDKEGDIHPLAPRTIKYRRSEVGPVTKTAPRGIPALDLSRVMSLLIGRAHTTSAEFWWGFDSVTGDSFAKILHYWADDQGHDVFGLSPQGTAWTLARAMKDWEAWKASPEAQRLTVGRPGIPAARQVRKPLPKVTFMGRVDLENMDLAGHEAQIQKAIEAGRFTGFRRLNARGEQWKPGHGLGPGPIKPPPPKPAPPKPAPPKPAPKPELPAPTPLLPKLQPIPVSRAMEIDPAFISPRIERAANATFGAIDKIHSDGNLPRIPVRSMDRPDYEGYLKIDPATSRPRALEINKAADTPRLTTAHETGHAIDYAGIPLTKPRIGVDRDFRGEERFKDFIKAIDASDSIKTLRERTTQTVHPEWKAFTIDQKHVAYLLQDNEIWARAYSQWVAQRSGDLSMAAEIEHRLVLDQQKMYAYQWQADDFEPIARAIDGIFQELGWLK